MTRIAVSGTHCSGKSTLIDDFLARHRDSIHLSEPYELAELHGEILGSDADSFLRQLDLCTEQLERHGAETNLIADRAPIDFLAYLLALDTDIAPAIPIAARGMRHIDVLVVLAADEIAAPEDEDPALREDMNARLLDLIAGEAGELLEGVRVVEIRGNRAQRLAALERAIVGT